MDRHQSEELRGQFGQGPWSQRVRRSREELGATDTSMDELLDASFEELAVAEEELRIQEEQLADAGAALVAERARYQALFEQAPVPYLTTSIEGVIREANRAAAELLGVKRLHAVGKPLSVFVPAAARQAFRRALNEIAHAEGPASFELQLLPRHGERRLATAAVGVATDTRGRASELRWLLVDETARRMHERRLAEANAELEARVAERTAELRLRDAEREQLLRVAEQERRAAETANRGKTELLAVVSHEMRTPLSAALGYIELLIAGLRGPLSETQRDDLERVHRAHSHVLRLMEDLLLYFRTGEGRLPVEIATVAVAETLADVAPMVRTQAQARGVTIRVRGDHPHLLVRADPERLRQIVLNLLANAIKFTPDGGEVELGWDADDASAYVFVRDNGIGIPADRVEELFEPFVQLGAPRAGTTGFGLGLAISRRLARAMGGDLVVTSVVGQGSTFTVRLPRG